MAKLPPEKKWGRVFIHYKGKIASTTCQADGKEKVAERAAIPRGELAELCRKYPAGSIPPRLPTEVTSMPRIGKRMTVVLDPAFAAGYLKIAEATLPGWETGGQVQQRSLDILLRLFFGIGMVRDAVTGETRMVDLGDAVST